MKRGRGKVWSVNWSGISPPEEGQIVHRVTPTSQSGGYWRVNSVRQIKTRRRLPEGYTAAFKVGVDYLGDSIDDDMPVAWTLYAHARTPRLPPMKDISKDRFSPLLDAGDESE